jgi:uncharacterized protein involved in type VI secretion and phage assembly
MSKTSEHLSHFYIKLNGQDAPEELRRVVETISVESSLHLPDVATIIVNDPSLKWIDDANLEPGKELIITTKEAVDVGAQANEKVIFDGEIVEVEPEFGASTQRLTIRAFDRLHRLSHLWRARSFINVKDSDLVQKLAAEVGLQPKAESTSQVYQYLFQANQTNLAFLQERAALNGFLLFVRGKELYFEKPKTNGVVAELSWSANLGEFRPRMTVMGQATDVTVRGWDPKKCAEIIGKSTSSQSGPKLNGQSDGGALLKKAFNLETHHLIATLPIREQDEAKRVAQAYADRYNSSFVEAEGVCGGDPHIVAGASVKISNVGNRFSGQYFVTSATHTIDAEGYVTSFTVSGLSPSTLLATLRPETETPITTGLVIGLVTDNKDPEGMGRVKVKFPWLTSEHASDWARVVSVGGGTARGIQFLPEVNDEVLVGFEHDDIHFPYVIGGLWNGKANPPMKNGQAVKNDKVEQRAIRSRIGHEIVFGEDTSGSSKGFISIKTTSGKEINISDTDKKIEIKSEKHTIKLDDQGNAVSIDTPGDIKIKATGKITVEGQQGVEMKGLKVDVEANSSMSLKANASMQVQANATMDVKSTGILNIQGTMVKIN